MALITWSNDLSVEINEIDGQHKELVRLINELNDAMATGKGKEVIIDTLTGLADYTVSHFGNEETYFKKFNYEGYSAHKAEHDAFVKKVLDFSKDFEAGNTALSLEVLRFLKDWLIKHIQGTDKKYIPCMHANGIR